MLMTRKHVLVALVCICHIGCELSSTDKSQPEGGGNVEQSANATPAPTAEQARAHVQKYVDQFLGGNTSLKMKLLSIGGVHFDTVDSLEIVRAVQTYSPDGKPIENSFTVVLKASGYDSLDRKNVQRTIDHLVMFRNGKWVIVGTDLESP
ncbi:MAG: hypothetical protein HQ518_11330 [Rhodopirellula sp.]|nr:hypothetical protein [Rhodopirellula sp.]